MQQESKESKESIVQRLRTAVHPQWVDLEGGDFVQGSDDFYPDEAPVRHAQVDAFAISATPVTNLQFAAFIEATGYVTVAEREVPGARDTPEVPDPRNAPASSHAPGSLVFTRTEGPVDLSDWRQWWRWVPGAQWRHPAGEGEGPCASRIPAHPVVQIAYEDALAYASWAGGRLPVEEELEYAACGGARPAPYAWGGTRDLDGRLMANTWRGSFPYRSTGANGWIGSSPVATFPPNGYGLFDTIGNVWEWSTTLYDAAQPAISSPQSSACACSPGGSPVQGGSSTQGHQASSVRRRVLKGGSHLCAPEYCLRYRPAARSPQSEDSATTHIGFRVVRDAG